MKHQAIVYGIIGLIVGTALTAAAMSTGVGDNSGSTSMGHGSAMGMNGMMKSLDGKSGDEFDRAFISAMIEHHQGAIDMAKEAQIRAEHEEVKAMANGIISAQESEISQMEKWNKDWGYGN